MNCQKLEENATELTGCRKKVLIGHRILVLINNDRLQITDGVDR